MAPPNNPNRRQPGRFATLADLQNSGSSAPPPHSHDGDDSDDQDFFAGGEKSGLAVQNPNSGPSSQPSAGPNRFINSIIDRARRNVPRPGGDDEPPPRNNFTGRARTIGGDDTPSVVVSAGNDPSSNPRPPVLRRMHLWRDGFSIDEGELYRYDDPNNAEILEMINSGRAPMSILDVQQGQEVNLEVHPHRDEDYKPPPKKYNPFSGRGRRLGDPAPREGSSSTSVPMPAAGSSTSTPAAVSVNESEPTITIAFRLANGTMMRSRFNTTHTVGDLYSFVNAAATENMQRPYVLLTMFPTTELNDRDVMLADNPDLNQGGNVVQRWT